VGLAFKLALVPVHFGALDAYTAGAPALVGFVQVASKLGAVIALARLAREAGASMHTVLLVVGLTTIVWGVLASFAQTDFRRLLAYSAVAHAGFLALAAGVNDTGIGLRTVGFYIVGYGAAALLCFACLAGRGTGPLPLNALDREKLGPLRALGLMIGLLSLAGVPPLPGFWVKIAVLRISWDSYGPTATIIAALGGVFGVIYYLRPLPQLFAEIRRGTPAANGTRFAIVASAAIVLALGFVPALAWNLALSN
jgi:NADH-quinone oxidoreductase subunit N